MKSYATADETDKFRKLTFWTDAPVCRRWSYTLTYFVINQKYFTSKFIEWMNYWWVPHSHRNWTGYYKQMTPGNKGHSAPWSASRA